MFKIIDQLLTPLKKASTCLAKKPAFYFWLSAISIFVFSWLIQNSILLSWDVSILLHETQRLLSGGSYVKDYFETNPPMILYLYIPPVLISKFFPITGIDSFRVYVFFLSLFSLALCRSLSKSLFLPEDRLVCNLFSLCIAALFLLVPFYELGQREHLFFIFSLPYLLAVSLRLEGKAIKKRLACITGLLAGLGFAIKPFFLVTPILIEAYFAFRKKTLLSWLRPETLAIFTVMGFYTLIALFLHPDYFHIVVPYAARLYYSSINFSWSRVILHPVTIFCCFVLIFYISQFKAIYYKELSTILCIALLSFITIFIAQRFPPFYHLLPPFSLAILLLVFLFSLIASQQAIEKKQAIFMLLLGGFYFYFLCTYARINWFNYFIFPALAPIAWGFFTILFASLMVLIKIKNRVRALSTISLVIGTGYWFSHTSVCMASNHAFSSTVLVMLLLFMLLAGKTPLHKLTIFGLGTFGMLLFSYPVYLATDAYFYAQDYKKSVGRIISYMKTQVQHQSIYLFSSESNYIFPVIDYANVSSVSRFPYFWMLPALMAKTYSSNNRETSPQALKDKNFLIHMIAEDLTYKKPDLVFIDVKKHKTNFKANLNFNYLNYFGANRDFQNAWKCYHYQATLKGDEQNLIFDHYQFDIYKRDSC